MILKPVGVQLLTEREFLNQTGQRTGAAPASPLAERFAQVITELLASNRLHQYTQLVQDFRTIEVAQLLWFKRVPAQSLRYFLQDYPLMEVETPAFVGGIRREEQGEVAVKIWGQVLQSRITTSQLVKCKLSVRQNAGM